MQSILWASEGLNRSATTANSDMLSPHEVFFGGRPPIPVFRSASQRTIGSRGRVKWTARLARVISGILGTITGAIVSRS